MAFEHVQKVAIIGAGVAGLQALKELRSIGKDVVVFERSSNVGGVWRENYADFGLQVPKELYEFPGFPFPKTASKFPSGPETQAYIESYAEHFDLRGPIRFNTSVVRIVAPDSGRHGWRIHSKGESSFHETVEDFDFCVVATGMYSWPPHIPLSKGHEKFTESGGEILHSSTFTDRSQASGKRCLVVGGGKSAIDNAVSAAKTGEACTLVYREPHWPVPRYLLNLVPFKWGTYSRFGHFMLPPIYDEPGCAACCHGLFKPAKWAWWRTVELMFRGQFRLSRSAVPQEGIEVDLFSGGQILNYEYRDMLAKGRLRAVQASIEHFTPRSVVLSTGEEIEVDQVIYGTGFKKSYTIFDEPVRQKLNVQDDGLYLYRNMIPTQVSDLAFVGSEVSTFNNILTHGLQVKWLAGLLQGKVSLPSPEDMEGCVAKEQAWKRSWMPAIKSRAAIWQLHMMKYHDRICKDLGVPHKRKGANCFGEVFAPYTARDYAALFH